MILPDYHGGSIVNLMASLIQGLGGGATPYPPLAALPPAQLSEARNVVLLVVDGLGHHHLVQGGAAGHLQRHLQGCITSVFPSTTATAIPAFLTGLAPQQHGLTGWHMYFRELGAVAAVLPFKARHGGQTFKEAGVNPAALLAPAPIFDRLTAHTHVVSPQRIVHSDFNVAYSGHARRHGYATLEQMFDTLRDILRGSAERKYLYVYYPELDGLAHEYGMESREVAACLAELDAAFGRFLAAAAGSDSLIIVTADHGFTDLGAEDLIELSDHPQLAETLVLPLCGECRVAYCYVHPDRAQQFEHYVHAELAGRAMLFNSATLVERGYFGLGAPHPQLLSRIGHYTLIMQQNYALKDWILGERRYRQIGVHGGMSAREMYVPLIVASA